MTIFFASHCIMMNFNKSLFLLAENSTPKKADVTNTPPQTSQTVIKSPSKSSKLDVDNFVPETDAIDNFLEDTEDRLAMMNVKDEDTDDDEMPNNDNPMVASFAEDVDIDDYIPGQQDTV